MIDAHMHLWRRARGDYGWLTPEVRPLWRDFEPLDGIAKLTENSIDQAILVQAAPTEAETDFLLDIAERHREFAGVVGWLDLAAKDAPDRVAKRARHPLFKGVRPMIHDIDDPEWMLRSDLAPGIAALISHNLTFDALIKPHHLDILRRFIGRYPDLRIIIDHGAKPSIDAAIFGPWRTSMLKLGRESYVYCKLSGLVTEIGQDWHIDQLQPIFETLYEAFGPDRLVWGSDWPVLNLASDYANWLSAAMALVSAIANDAQCAAIFDENARRFYNIEKRGLQ